MEPHAGLAGEGRMPEMLGVAVSARVKSGVNSVTANRAA